MGGPGMMGMGGGGMLDLVKNEKVQKEIELVDDQKDKIKTLAKEIDDARKAKFEKAQKENKDLSREERQKKMREMMQEGMKEMAEESKKTDKKIEEILLPHQLERIKQIQLQSQLQISVALAFSSPDVAKELGLTDEQKEKIKAIGEESRKAMGEMRPGGGRRGNGGDPNAERPSREEMQKIFEKMAKSREENEKKYMEVLTSEQKEKLEKMKGKAFDLPSMMPNFGNGQGRGNRRGGNQNPPPGNDNPPPASEVQ
jgi:Spy/CpxP family protein refolding chaperone